MVAWKAKRFNSSGIWNFKSGMISGWKLWQLSPFRHAVIWSFWILSPIISEMDWRCERVSRRAVRCVCEHVNVGIVAMWCVNTSPAINWSISWWNLMKGNTKFHRTDSYPKVCFRVVYEPFSEVESAPIRSAVKFYVGMDAPIFSSTFSKNVFDRSKNKLKKNLKAIKPLETKRRKIKFTPRYSQITTL